MNGAAQAIADWANETVGLIVVTNGVLIYALLILLILMIGVFAIVGHWIDVARSRK